MKNLPMNIVAKVEALALENDSTTTEVLEHALQLYSDSKCLRMLEKQLPNGSYRVVTLHPYGMCIEHITKRINIDGFKDIDILLQDGYYPIPQ